MNTSEKVEQLLSRINKTPVTAKNELSSLFDEGSFVEIGLFNECSVVTGYGTINGNLVYGYCQDGTVNSSHAEKIARIYELALEVGSPVVGILNSNGVELSEISNSFKTYGTLLANQSKASGVIPQISIVIGDCIGMSSFIPALSDFTFIVNKAKMFLSSPNTFKGIDGKSLTPEDFGGSSACAKRGTVTEQFETTTSCYEKVRELISILPANNMDYDFTDSTDDLNREDSMLNSIIPNEKDSFDVLKVINSVADNNMFFELKKEYATSIITGLLKLDGITTGVIANNGLISSESAEKAASFVTFCDSFNIPIITFTDVCGYEKNSLEEQKGIIKNSAKLISAFVNATVPKLNVILRNAIGSSYMLMNSKSTGADMVLAWPTAYIASLDKESATKLFEINENDFDVISSPYHYAEKGQIDDIIVPAVTRKRLLVAMEMLINKKISTPDKKHNSI